MATQQKRMLTTERSKLGNVDLSIILRKEGAWNTLPEEARSNMYSLLPAPGIAEEPHDISVNPLKTKYRPFIEEALRVWQDDLRSGRETKKWREEAMQAGHDREAGLFDEYRKVQREEYWGDAAAEEEKDGLHNGNGKVQISDEEGADGVAHEDQTEQAAKSEQ